MRNLLPNRVPIAYIILAVLVAVAVVPLWFYGTGVVAKNREQLITNERLLQNTVTRSLGGEISQRQTSITALLTNLTMAVQVTSGGNLTEEHVNAPELRALLEGVVTSTDSIAFATLLNTEKKGISAGRIAIDEFMNRELEYAFAASQQNRAYNGQALSVGSGKNRKTLMIVSTPITAPGGQFLGMVSAAVDLDFVVRRLKEAEQGGLQAYVVDRQGRLVASADEKFATGENMTAYDIVKNFVDQAGKARFIVTNEFEHKEAEGKLVAMLGTYSPVPTLEWAVIAQKRQSDAYQSVIEMEANALKLAVAAALISILVSIYASRKITTPLRTLTQSSRAIAKGDFSQRVALKSRTEIGELAETFNHMSADLERFIHDLKRAAEENRELFMSSIQMIAGAVDEKDPYTRGHSDRVTKYSVLIAKELGFSEEEVENVRVAAQLHDVGKIGIEDRILKKPGALTPEEFEIMKTHTTKGASILRPVAQLRDMIPGIELHHESLDGRGYPYGLKGEAIPILPRIIMVADTFDAMTTDRPYQVAMEAEYVIRIINSLAGTKFDPKCVAAFTACFERGLLKKEQRPAGMTPELAVAAAAGVNGNGRIPRDVPAPEHLETAVETRTM